MSYKFDYTKMTGKTFIIAGLIKSGKIQLPKPQCRQCSSRLDEDHEPGCKFRDTVKVFFGQTTAGANGERCHVCDKRKGSYHSPSCSYVGVVAFGENYSRPAVKNESGLFEKVVNASILGIVPHRKPSYEELEASLKVLSANITEKSILIERLEKEKETYSTQAADLLLQRNRQEKLIEERDKTIAELNQSNDEIIKIGNERIDVINRLTRTNTKLYNLLDSYHTTDGKEAWEIKRQELLNKMDMEDNGETPASLPRPDKADRCKHCGELVGMHHNEDCPYYSDDIVSLKHIQSKDNIRPKCFGNYRVSGLCCSDEKNRCIVDVHCQVKRSANLKDKLSNPGR